MKGFARNLSTYIKKNDEDSMTSSIFTESESD